jgi:hypothetical protein
MRPGSGLQQARPNISAENTRRRAKETTLEGLVQQPDILMGRTAQGAFLTGSRQGQNYVSSTQLQTKNTANFVEDRRRSQPL